jgi:hypothetical protein
LKAAGDHEMEDEKELTFEFKHDPLADSSEADRRPVLQRRGRRRHGAEQEGVVELDMQQPRPDDA